MNSHKNSAYKAPPPDGSSGGAGNSRVSTSASRLLPVLEKAKVLYKDWLEIYRNIERRTRFGIGTKIDLLFLDTLDLLRKAAYNPVDKKILLLNQVLEKLDSLRFFFQLLWEAHLIPSEKYSAFAPRIEELGRIVGGWRKGLIEKVEKEKTEHQTGPERK